MNPTWIIHQMLDYKHTSYHTHGLNVYGSLEIELNLPLEASQAASILDEIAVNIVESGKRYQSGDKDTELFEQPFYVLETRPLNPEPGDDKSLLRVIFNDPHNKYPWDEDCDQTYKYQLSQDEIQKMRKLLSH